MRSIQPLRCVASASLFLCALPAQFPALAPTSNVTIVTTPAPLHYSSIMIPAGVTVTFTGTDPAVLLCDGDCVVDGTLSAAANGTTDGPGAVATGIGAPGLFCMGFCGGFGCGCYNLFQSPGAGRHWSFYGSAVPFRLSGGSPGGSLYSYGNSNPLVGGCCDVFGGSSAGGGGGGTLVVLAEGSILVNGLIDVRGATIASAGSAGSILLRGAGGATISPTGVLEGGPSGTLGGYVRVDAWGALPVVQGTIAAPQPELIELPHLFASAPPTIGTTWSIEVFAPAGSIAALGVSSQPAPGTATPFGTLAIDLASGFVYGPAVATGAAHDPGAVFSVPVPNNPQLLGLQLWLQGMALPLSLAPRLSNVITASVQ